MVEFLQGLHAELRNVLLVAPYLLMENSKTNIGFAQVLKEVMYNVFKKESMKPLLYFLAEKQYQRKAADDLLERLGLVSADDATLDSQSTPAAREQ